MPGPLFFFFGYPSTRDLKTPGADKLLELHLDIGTFLHEPLEIVAGDFVNRRQILRGTDIGGTAFGEASGCKLPDDGRGMEGNAGTGDLQSAVGQYVAAVVRCPLSDEVVARPQIELLQRQGEAGFFAHVHLSEDHRSAKEFPRFCQVTKPFLNSFVFIEEFLNHPGVEAD